MARPIIGITASHCQPLFINEFNEPRGEHQYLYHNYVKAVWLAGGNPVIIPVGLGEEAAMESLLICHGLLLPGGVDINPVRYHEKPSPELGRVDDFKDESELKVARIAFGRRMPIFGICRGIQVLTAALGGKLYQDIPSELPNSIKHNYRDDDLNGVHKVKIESDSFLMAVMKCEEVEVKSFHHQGIKAPPDGWNISARAEDGLTEAIEFSLEPFQIAVQWHPEVKIEEHPEQINLFAEFIESCKD